MKILIVDDSSTMRLMIKLALKPLNFEILEAQNGIEGLEQANNNDIDLVLTDLNMPEMNGVDFIKYLRQNEKYKNVPVIVISTEKGTQDKETMKNLGTLDYLCKPFKTNELIKIVKEKLGA